MTKKQPAHSLGRFLLKTAGTLSFIAIIAILLAGFGYYSHPLVTQKTIGLLEKTLDARCEASRVSIRPWGTLKIDSLTIVRLNNFGTEDRALCPEVLISFRFFALLLNYNKIFISGKFDTLKAATVRKEYRFQKNAPGDLLKLPIGSIVYNVRFDACSGVYMPVINVNLSGEGIEGKLDIGKETIDGKISFSEIQADRWQAENGELELTLNHSEVDIKRFKAHVYGGRCTLSGKYDLQNKALAPSVLKLSRINLETFYRALENPQGVIHGKADMTMHFEAKPLSLHTLKAKGRMQIKDMITQDVPIQKTMMVALFIPALSRISFKKVAVAYRLKDGKIYTDEIIAEGDTLSLRSVGDVAYNGYVNQEFEGVLSKKFTKNLSRVVRSSMIENDKGECSFRGAIRGRIDNPRVELDEKILKRAVKNVFNEIGNGLRSIFKE
ncbi:MAG: hypothetical protein GF401_01130 [Chitinivibrionales bacterium]|nr:hypothetical protein [Chitinivibrionales bacterium]